MESGHQKLSGCFFLRDLRQPSKMNSRPRVGTSGLQVREAVSGSMGRDSPDRLGECWWERWSHDDYLMGLWTRTRLTLRNKHFIKGLNGFSFAMNPKKGNLTRTHSVRRLYVACVTNILTCVVLFVCVCVCQQTAVNWYCFVFSSSLRCPSEISQRWVFN